MLTLRMAGIIVGLLLASACQSPAATESAAGVPKPLTPVSQTNTPATGAAKIEESRSLVLVGLDQHWDSPSTVILMRPDGSVIAKRTLPGTWLVGAHALGAYLLVANDGSRKAWTVDASGEVREVAAAAAAILSTPDGRSAGSPLIVDSTTAVTVQCVADGCTADQLDLRTGVVRQLLTVARPTLLRDSPLQVLDLAADGHTVWLRKTSSSTSAGLANQAEIVGIDLRTGSISTPGRSTSILDGNLAITPDGTAVAGLEFVSIGQYAAGHLHVSSIDTGTDTDLQGTAELASASSGSRSIQFAPDGATVAWWGPLNFGPSGGTSVVNVAARHGGGRTLLRTANTARNEISDVFWVDPTTLLIQTDATATPGVFQGSNLQTFTIETTTGAKRSLPKDLHYLVAVLH